MSDCGIDISSYLAKMIETLVLCNQVCNRVTLNKLAMVVTGSLNIKVEKFRRTDGFGCGQASFTFKSAVALADSGIRKGFIIPRCFCT